MYLWTFCGFKFRDELIHLYAMHTTTPAHLATNEYYAFYAGYIAQVPANLTLEAALADSLQQLNSWFANVPESRSSEAYLAGKWTIGQTLQHNLDTERVFAYRALTFARGDGGPLPGYDQDDFAAAAGQPSRSLRQLQEELVALRGTTGQLFAGFDEAALLRRGVMSGHEHSVRAIGFICAGHLYHHAQHYAMHYPAGGKQLLN